MSAASHGAVLDTPRIVVIGAGIAGLSAARELLRAAPHADVRVLERESRVGGLIESELTPDGFLVEQGPDSLVAWKPSGMAAVRELGLADSLVTGTGVPRHAYVVQRGALVRMPDGLLSGVPTAAKPLFASPLLSVLAKLRLCGEPFIAAQHGDADESIASFVTRRFGAEVLDHVVAPLVAGIYGASAAQLSMRATMPQLCALEREHGSIAWGMFRTRRQRAQAKGKPQVLSLRAGMESLPRALAAELGTRVSLGAGVDSVGPGDARRFKLRGGSFTLDADAIVLATPAHVAARIVAPLDAALAAELGAIRHAPLCAVSLAFERAQLGALVPGTGFIVPVSEGRTTTACSFMSDKWPERAPAGHALLRSFLALPTEASDADAVAAALADLRDLLGITARPAWSRVRRRALGLPRYEVGHGERVQRIEHLAEQHGGLTLAGNALRGVGIPECLDSGKLAAQRTLHALHAVS